MGGGGANLGDRFLATAAAEPGREAVVVADDDRPMRRTYAELADRSTRLAVALQHRGVDPGARVGVLLDDGVEHLEALLACFLAAATPVNLSHRDTRAERGAVLHVADARFVLHEPDLDPLLPAEQTLCTCDWERAIDTAPPAPLAVRRSGDDEYVLFTGGTTGRPRGVRWRHDDLWTSALAPAARGAVRTMPASPFAHGTGQWTALSTLLQGGTVVCRRDRGFDPERTLDAVDEERVSYLVLVGDAFARPLADVLAACPGRWRLSSLTTLLSGGAPLSARVKDDLLRLVPTMLVVDGFGASETGGHGRAVSVAGSVAPGAPRFAFDDDTEVLGDDHRPVGTGDVGWLARRGRVPLGYVGDGADEDDARAFPVVDGVRWAIPGDRAQREPDGTITVLGRGASTINTGGYKVHAEEVERALLDHPAVIDTVVIGTPDERWGEQVTAVVAAAPSTLEDALLGHCRDRLASYKVPRRVVLVDHVRRSPAGKPDLAWARAICLARGSGLGADRP